MKISLVSRMLPKKLENLSALHIYIWVQYLHFVKVLKMYQEKEKSVQKPSESVLKNIKNGC